MKRELILSGILICLFLFAGIAGADLKNGLVGYWPLDGNGKDMAGKSEGELDGGANWTKNGRINGGVELDGATSCVSIKGFTLTTTELTAVAWMKGWKQADWAGIMCSRNDPMTFWVGFNPANTLSYVWNNNAAETYNWNKGPSIPEDEWAMTVITIAEDQAVGYVYTDADKLQSGVNKISHLEQTIADNLKIGRDECCGDTRHIMGIMDEVMIYDRVLSEDEVLQLATTGLAVVSEGKLTAQWGAIKQQ